MDEAEETRLEFQATASPHQPYRSRARGLKPSPAIGDLLAGRAVPSFMAAGRGSLESLADAVETDAAAGPGPVPTKRVRIDAVAKESVGGSNTGTEEVTQETPSAAVGEGSSTSHATFVNTPLPLRLPPYPMDGNKLDVRNWMMECRRIREINAEDPRRKLPTRREPKDPYTTNAVVSPIDKVVVRGVARSIVSMSFLHDGSKRTQCTGIIMGQRESNGKRHNLVVTCSKFISRNSTLLDPLPKLHVGLPNKTILDGQFLFFNDHYGITLLDVDVDFPLESPTLGSCPNYGQKVFVLARDSEFSLKARRGEILWLEESDYIGRNYQMFLSCEVPKAGSGGPVIDHDGNITGMAFYCSPNPYVLSISTIIRCIDMWMTFGRIARPMHGLGLRTFELLDVSVQEEISLDHGINSGFIVDKVSYDSAAEGVGILHGDMIVSLDERHAMTLPQLEDHFLKLGWMFLNNPNSMVDLKLEVYDLMKHSKRSITLPLQFSDA